LLQSKVNEPQRVNDTFRARRQQGNKWFEASSAVSVGKRQAIMDQDLVEAQIIGELPKAQRRSPTCSVCKQQSHTKRACKAKRPYANVPSNSI